MREIVFRLHPAAADRLQATAEHLPLTIAAPSLEELQHEAREALIQHFGSSHVTYRVRIRRTTTQAEDRQRSDCRRQAADLLPVTFGCRG